jgi:Rv0078B-related antitoxin
VSAVEDRKTNRPPVIEVIDDEMARVIRAKTGAERLRIASGMFSSARKMLVAYLRVQHPDWDEKAVQKEAARRLSHGAI